MSKAAVFLAEGFEEIEALTVVDILRRAEVETEMVSIAEEETAPLAVTGSHGITVTADSKITDTDFAALDMIVLPGGMPGTLNLEKSSILQMQIKAFHEEKRTVAAICAAPGILGRMGLLKGLKAVSHPSAEDDLQGAEIPSEGEVVVSDHIITSRGMGTAIPFALQLRHQLQGREKADAIAKAICFRAA